MRRLKNDVLQFLIDQKFDVVVADEAHRLKNIDAKRAIAVRKLCHAISYAILVTGTPIRNEVDDAFALIGHLEPTAIANLPQTIKNAKALLSHYMLRRTKAEILPQLPNKVRQTVQISIGEGRDMGKYRDALDDVKRSFEAALAEGETQAHARTTVGGEIAKARVALGRAKVLTGVPAELIGEIVDEKGSVVAFAEHREVSDLLAGQLRDRGLKVAVLDGRLRAKERARVERDFQGGAIDVVIGGMQCAGEAISLTRADTVVFVELDWVPSAMRQAEDRIHRIGQKAESCHVLHLVARFEREGVANVDEILHRVLARKIALVDSILSDGVGQVFAEDAKQSLQREVVDRILEIGGAQTARATEMLPNPKKEDPRQ